MPEFEFYARKSEWWALLAGILQTCEVKFAADRWYQTPQCDYYDTVTDGAKAAILTGKPRVFLLAKDGMGNLRLERQDAGPRKGQYYIDFTRGLPCIELLFPGDYEESGIIRLPPGSIVGQRKYETDDGSDVFKPGREFASLYPRVRQAIKSHLVQISKDVWISPTAKELVESNKAAILSNGRWLTGSRLSQSPSPRG